jgi:hypothetical protein
VERVLEPAGALGGLRPTGMRPWSGPGAHPARRVRPTRSLGKASTNAPRGRFREPTPHLRGRTGPLRLGTGSPQCPSSGRLASMAPRALDRARQPQPRSSQRSPPSAALLWTSESERRPVLAARPGGRPTRQSAPGSCRATGSGRWRPPQSTPDACGRCRRMAASAVRTVASSQQWNAPPGVGAPREDQANPDLPCRSLQCGRSCSRGDAPRSQHRRHCFGGPRRR